MKRLYQYLHRLAENQRWMAFSITTGAGAWLIAALIILPFALLGFSAPYVSPKDGSIWHALNALLLAPLIENALFVAVILILRNHMPSLGVIAISTAIASILHCLYAPLASISAFVLFGLMSSSYILFSKYERGLGFRVMLIQHITFNAPLSIGLML